MESSLTLPQRIARARRRLVRLHYEAKVGHLGGNLSCLDAMMTVFQRVDWSRDHFVLSKGHSAGALYVSLWDAGRLGDDELQGFHRDGSWLGGHPPPNWRPEIPFPAGSLGHGLPQATGLALGLKLRAREGHVYVLTSDGEWQEGSNWEAFQFIRHHRLDNLTVLIDRNGLQGFGGVDDVCRRDLARELRDENVDARAFSGHDPERLARELDAHHGRPRFFVLDTEKGYPLSFLRGRLDSHYWPLTDEQYERALRELPDPAEVPRAQ